MSIRVIAIDGTAASGKGTLARRLARQLGYAYLDTGKLYRYVGYSIVRDGNDPADEATAEEKARGLEGHLNSDMLADPVLTSDIAGDAASKVAVFDGVRAALLDFQRNFAAKPPENAKGAILDGRDIGTVICPDADLKLFIDANVEIRAKRRYKELQSKEIPVTYGAVLADMRARDARDSGRKNAPMKPADDAIVLDTSEMTAEDVLNKALSLI